VEHVAEQAEGHEVIDGALVLEDDVQVHGRGPWGAPGDAEEPVGVALVELLVDE
jgi:hypothetical protein